MKILSIRAVAALLAALATTAPAQRADVWEEMQSQREQQRKVVELAGRPIPVPPNNPDHVTYSQQLAAFYTRILPGAYETVGRRNEAWDEEALALLKDMAALFAETADFVDESACLARAQGLVDRGCDDAAVLFSHAALLHNSGKTEAAGPALHKAQAALESSGYPRVLLRYTCMRIARFYWDDAYRNRDLIDAALRCAVSATAEMLRNKEFTDAESRICFHTLFESWGGLFSKHHAELNAIFDEAEFSPWLRELIEGEREIGRAWEARGSGWARSVKEAGWTGFYEHLDNARAHLMKAWELRQDAPEPATRMIKVAKGQGSNEEARVWFERAIAVEFGNMVAYRGYLDAISDRWLGSLEAMYQFGIACLETERFDTRVPFMYFNVLDAISNEPGSDQSLIRLPRTYTRLQDMFAGYEGARQGANLVYWKSLHAATAWKYGYYPEAARLFREIGTNAMATSIVAAVIMQYYQTPAARVLGESFALTGPDADAIRDMIHLAEAGRWAEALNASTAIVARVEPGTDVATYLDTYRSAIAAKLNLAKGAEVALVPDKTFVGWRILSGSWGLLDNGDLKGTSNKGMKLLYDQPFEGDFECEVKIVFDSSPYKYLFNAGILFGFADESPDEYQTFLIYRAEQYGVLSHKFNTNEGVSVAAPVTEQTNHLTLRVAQGLVSTTVNGQPVHTDVPLRIRPTKGGMRIGIGGYYWYRNVEIRFKDLKIRRLVPGQSGPGPAKGPEMKTG